MLNHQFHKSGLKTVFILLLAVYLPVTGLAWGVIGHRVVGEIASLHLTAKARKEIQQILGTESIAMASNWADFIKSDSTYDYIYNWHFLNINESVTYDQFIQRLKNDTAVDAYTKTNMIVDSLRNKSLSKDKKLFYLKLLIHFVGDIHQPMHVARFDDLGGNKVRVQWFNQPSNLHRLWDEQLIEFQQLSYTEFATAINHSTLAQRNAWQKQPLTDWIFETYQESRKVYAYIKEENPKLSYRYNYDHVDMLKSQLLKGGIRLAGLLNQLFG
jgi:nuclease S1